MTVTEKDTFEVAESALAGPAAEHLWMHFTRMSS